MKLIYALLLLLLVPINNILGQDDALFQTWRLTYMTVELGSDINVLNVNPEINTTLTITEDFIFQGNSGCNDYSGTFLYNSDENTIVTESFSSTLLGCEFDSHQEIEDTYYSYLNEFGSDPMRYEIYESNDGNLELNIEMQIPGFELYFTNQLLNTTSYKLNEVKIFPNPSSNRIHIESLGTNVEEIIIYNAQGQKILETSTTIIDIAGLKDGLYFIEIISEGIKGIQKFIKQ